MLSLNRVSDLERLVGSLSGEMALIEVGKDEGLVPAYTLLGELMEILEEDAESRARCERVQGALGDLLDKGGIFDQPTVDVLGLYTEQVQCYLRYYRMGEVIAWKELESQWDPSLGGQAAESAGSAALKPESPTPEPAAGKSAATSNPNDVLMVLDLEDSREVLEEFFQEAMEHLENIEAALLDLENDPKDQDAISSVFRSFHTIKGVAGFLDLTPIRVLAHEIETLLDLVRSDRMDLTESVVSLILESRDRLQSLMGQVQEGLNEGAQPSKIIMVSDLIARTHVLMEKRPASANNAVAAAGEPAEGPVQTLDFGPPAEEEEVIPVSGPPVGGSAPDEAPDAARKRATQGDLGSAATIRMNTVKLDGIIDAVGELVIVESQLRDSILSAGTTSARIERNLAQLGRITGELQRSGLSLRMVSLKQLFQKMQRLARDLANKSGKKVLFRTEGEDTEMDRTVVEKIGDPLVHMIRNSMDHGIEPPEEREAAGKAEMGEVVLKAYYQGDNIVLELTDDGRGIRADKVLKKAVERGLAQEGKTYSREEIISFLFLAGFSTAEKVSDISGRGVGMDVVRSNVQKLRGRIDLTSVEGKGSTVRISLPLTMAIIDGLLIRVGDQRYILPVMSVNMTLKPRNGQIYRVQGKGNVIKHREQIFQLIHLGKYFGVKADAQTAEDGVVVMIDTDLMCYGLIVDEILHKQEVVVKNLGGTTSHPAGVSGGAILGDGTISLILDPSGLLGGHQAVHPDEA